MTLGKGMHGQSYSSATENEQLMGNKQVITIFFIGILMLVAAFWAGLTIIKGSVTGGNKSAATVSKSTRAGESPSTQAAAGSVVAMNSSANGDARYVVRVAAYGTQEEAQKIVDDLKGERYLSAHIRTPDAENALYRVFIGPFELRDAAQQVANELAAAGKKGLMIYQDNEK